MNPKLEKLIKMMQRHEKPDDIWNRGEPMSQPAFRYENGEWKEHTSKSSTAAVMKSDFSVLSWNIDFMRSFGEERMKKALQVLKEYTNQVSNPVLIMLNEMVESDLALIQAQAWVQDDYFLTDVSNTYWESGYYGTCMLIPHSVPISNVFRVHYEVTAMQRDALFVDVNLKGKILRLCSTHLESLISQQPKRPGQLATAARFMHQADAAILGGDLNAIEPFDKSLHLDNNLKDAYLVSGGKEDDALGMTWGQMAPTKDREKFGLSRMDKLLFCGAVELEKFELFGMDVVIEDADIAQQLMEEDGLEMPWVTDHVGVRADFHYVATTGDANL